MEFSTGEIASMLGGKIEGDSTVKVSTISKIQEGKPGSISFFSNPKYEPFLYETEASAVLVNKDFQPKKKIKATIIYVEDAYTAFSNLLEQYQKLLQSQKVGVENPSFIHETASVAEGVYIGAFAYIGANCQIGANCKIYPHAYIGDNSVLGDNTVIYSGVKIYPNTQIGAHCTIQASTVIGSDGFGFAPQPDGSYKSIPQIGNVVIEDHVDIGANTVIDCATMGSTIIEEGVKMDNLIQIAHNVKIGKNSVIVSQTGISGSTTLGENCVVAGQVGIVGHLNLPNGTQIAAQSGLARAPKKEGEKLMGAPAMEVKQFMKSSAVFKQLPEMRQQLNALQKQIDELEKDHNS